MSGILIKIFAGTGNPSDDGVFALAIITFLAVVNIIIYLITNFQDILSRINRFIKILHIKVDEINDNNSS